MDTLVFDIETKNFFTDPGVGWNNFEALEISMVCVYSYSKNKYFSFDENELEKAAELFDSGNILVGFSSNRYDIPVLDAHFKKLGCVSGVNPVRGRAPRGARSTRLLARAASKRGQNKDSVVLLALLKFTLITSPVLAFGTKSSLLSRYKS